MLAQRPHGLRHGVMLQKQAPIGYGVATSRLVCGEERRGETSRRIGLGHEPANALPHGRLVLRNYCLPVGHCVQESTRSDAKIEWVCIL
jgi:hypothetical protein